MGSGLVELKYSSVVISLVEADEYGNELFDSLPIIIKEEDLKHSGLFLKYDLTKFFVFVQFQNYFSLRRFQFDEIFRIFN